MSRNIIRTLVDPQAPLKLRKEELSKAECRLQPEG